MLKIGILRALLLFCIFLSSSLSAQEFGFIANDGQWEGDFDFRLNRHDNFIYLRADEQRVLLVEPKPHFDHTHEPIPKIDKVAQHAYRFKWIGANPNAQHEVRSMRNVPKLNYLLGDDPSQWAAGLKQYEEVTYQDLYPNIDLRYYVTETGACKFDFIVHPGGDPSQIKWQVDGVDRAGKLAEDLVLLTDIQNPVYSKPEAFQENEEISCYFSDLGDQQFGFDLGDYDDNSILIIDPTLVFSTYSGSIDDNFGFSATFGEDGTAYGAGINFIYQNVGRTFPTTLGAFQDSSVGGVLDITIAKYTADGTNQVYATFFGGNRNELPFSLLEGPNKSLIILGVTGSDQFPIAPSSYDTSFAFGNSTTMNIGGQVDFVNSSDIFISILDSTGGALLGSTYLGNYAQDGNNAHVNFNYGDPARGDITIDQNGNIIISSFTFSDSLSTPGTNTSYGGTQDGIVASFNSDLSQLNWLSYIGGEGDDAVFSLRYTNNGQLFACGGTESDTLFFDTAGVFQSERAGDMDAFLVEMNPQNGQVLKFTYSGTEEDDIAYFLDFDPAGDPIIFGQTFGKWPVVGDSVWGVDSSAQFLQRLSADFSQVSKSTTFGDGKRDSTDISPTALMVSDCGDIFISGWGASYGRRMGMVRNLPVTHDAIKKTGDRGDFYFLRLDASWERLEYASYFGQVGGSPDHVDGGSSRFRKDGSIFQAVCACGANQGFPTTPGAFRDTKVNRCNLAVFRYDMEADSIRADVRFSRTNLDSICLPDSVSFQDFSFNADVVLFREQGGTFDTLDLRFIPILDSGVTRFEFVALDTNCGLVDSSAIQVFAYSEPTMADFRINYDSCDPSGAISIENLSSGSDRYRWLYSTGDSSNQFEPSLSLPAGDYEITLIVENTACQQVDTLSQSLKVSEINNFTRLRSDWDACDPERLISAQIASSGFHNYNWTLDGVALNQNTDTLNWRVPEGGFHTLQLEIIDTVCNRSQSFEEEIYFYDEDFDISFPNIFTPNGDGINEEFKVLDGERLEPILAKSEIEIYNRHGTLLFKGDFLKEAWNGQAEGQELPPGVYYYVFNYEDICGQVSTENGFVHLQR